MIEKSIRSLENIIEISLYLLIFCLPFSNSLVEIFAVIAIIALIIKKLLQYRLYGEKKFLRPVNTGINIGLYGFVILALIAAFLGEDVGHSLKKWMGVYLKNIALFFVIAETFSELKKIKRILYVISVTVVFILIDLVVQHLTGVDFVRKIPAYTANRLNASFNNPNDFAAWLSVFIPINIGIWIFFSNYYKRTKKFFYIILFFVVLCFCFWGLFYASSRGAFLGVLLALVFMFGFTKKKLFLIPMFILSFLVLMSSSDLKTRVAGSFSDNSTINKDRIDLWKEALVVIEDNPLFGVGVGNYMKVTTSLMYAHNSYLQLAAENGIPCMLVFVFSIGIFFLKNIKMILFANERSQTTCLLIGFLAGDLVYLFHAGVDTHFSSLKIFALFWILIGITAGINREIESSVTTSDKYEQ
ncbi:MAG: O-antigen ligase family protein [Candidatus Omnitrophica bacterium]|nr:O-antigen ligase family protein [Candidatus Omnitrophota bacterium]